MGERQKKLARRVIIPSMQILKAVKSNQHSEVEYRQNYPDEDATYPHYPILIRGDGVPWTLGNIYLLKRLEFGRRYEASTWQNIADHLLDFLRWIEATDTDPLHFPESHFSRPTYSYQNYLIEQVEKGSLSKNTAASRISAVLNLYKGLVAYEIIANDLLALTHEERVKAIKVLGNDYTFKDIRIRSSNLSINRESPKNNSDTIQDSGSLRPLSQDEQNIIFDALKHSESTYRLMFALSILTGARIQTVCTFRGKSIIEADYIETKNSYLVRVGGTGSLVDTKNNKEHTLVIPALLREKMLNYWFSDAALQRRLISFYANDDTNYLFLTKQGTPFYTSRQERRDRLLQEMLDTDKDNLFISKSKDRSGQSVREYIKNTLLPRIRRNHPNFRAFTFHDLRATFGMNLLETLLTYVDSQNEKYKKLGLSQRMTTSNALEDVAERMGHSDIETTMRYLNYRRNKQFKAEVQSKVEEALMQFVPDDVLGDKHA